MAHSTLKDLVNWTPHKPTIFPLQQANIKGCWSCSAAILPGGKPVMLYIGIDLQERRVQNLAIPKNLSDPYLTKWIKYPKNPVMAPTSKNKINASAFRDPITTWLGPDKMWRVLIGSRVNKLGLAILYKSKDFEHWTPAEKPLHSAEAHGWKKVKYVLKNSLDETKHDYYTFGTYDVVKDKYFPYKGMTKGDLGLRYDYGKFYASKTFFDSEKQRRILQGWANESSSVKDDVQKGWTAVQVDIEVGFEVSHELKKVEVFKEKWYNPQLLCSKKKCFSERSSLNKHNDNTTYGAFVDLVPAREQLSLKSLIDRSILESFGRGGKAVITASVYPTQAIENKIKLFVFNNGTSSVKITYLNAWSIKRAQIS
ncbi:hypothetical protein JRO89_XS12G0090200 [Xanthoceras sorbifolium]|uniref:Beta-fructofuranosidase n=1 Tax=Xanthoceras sorbifolium TaxID=99658 RepID=A0ABQ8HBV7_9ROSI|nr:hypothetical protein JRO89_XS12G0090200 [Xanthoceras sorbifolium]